MIIFNLVALVICAVSFGAGFLVRHLAGASGEGLALRTKTTPSSWARPTTLPATRATSP